MGSCQNFQSGHYGENRTKAICDKFERDADKC
jgi:hypothetical protein